MTCCDILQQTATHCNALQQTATHCNTLQHTATHCCRLQHTATHCNTLQHTATYCNTKCIGCRCVLIHLLLHTTYWKSTTASNCSRVATHCNMLQHSALQLHHNYNALQHTTTLQHKMLLMQVCPPSYITSYYIFTCWYAVTHCITP